MCLNITIPCWPDDGWLMAETCTFISSWMYLNNIMPCWPDDGRVTVETYSQILIVCWPCISIYLIININQLDALNFIISLFQASTCFKQMCSSSGRQKLYYTVSGIITHIVGCIVQFWPPDDEHMCSKHVEAWNKLIIKFSPSSWLILIIKYSQM